MRTVFYSGARAKEDTPTFNLYHKTKYNELSTIKKDSDFKPTEKEYENGGIIILPNSFQKINRIAKHIEKGMIWSIGHYNTYELTLGGQFFDDSSICVYLTGTDSVKLLCLAGDMVTKLGVESVLVVDYYSGFVVEFTAADDCSDNMEGKLYQGICRYRG